MFFSFNLALCPTLQDCIHVEASTEDEAIIKVFKYVGEDMDFWIHAYVHLPSHLKAKVDSLKHLKETDFLSDLETEELKGLFQDQDWLDIANELEDWGFESFVFIS
jgi:hypothetical protein